MTKQYYSETYGLNAPENYESYFVPVIGEPLAIDLINLADLQPGEKVLDVGCGTGIVARLAAQKTGPGGSVTGLDINPGMLAVARSVETNGANIDWYESGAENIPLPDAAFDVVLCQLSLQFMENKSAALQEMNRVLKPGGRIILNVPGPAGSVFTHLAEAMERTISAEAAGFVNQVFCLHDDNELESLMIKAGFRDVQIMPKNKEFRLPSPGEFLWQYVHSTPLVGIMSQVDQAARLDLEREVVEKWQKHINNGDFIYQQRIVQVVAKK